MKILIVEDEVLIREGMSDSFMECSRGLLSRRWAGGPDLFSQRDAGSGLDIQPHPQWLEVLKTIRKTSQSPSSC